jgi:hypothetical protein
VNLRIASFPASLVAIESQAFNDCWDPGLVIFPGEPRNNLAVCAFPRDVADGPIRGRTAHLFPVSHVG